MQYIEMSKQVLEKIGGIENIKFVERCATRLRIHYVKKSEVDIEGLKAIDGIMGVVDKTGQIQLIIGPSVPEAYADFLEVSGFDVNTGAAKSSKVEEEDVVKNFGYYVNVFGNFATGVFMPIVPALITGGVILSIRVLLLNYFGMDIEGGTAHIMIAIFSAGFSLLPIWIGYTLAAKLKMEPIMGAFLGAVLVSGDISGVAGLDFFGIPVPAIEYGGSIMPIVFGVIFMYYVNKFLTKIIPEMFIYFAKPLLTMIIVVPVTLIVLGPIGTTFSGAVGAAISWAMSVAGFIAVPVVSALYPYMVMLGLDKAITPIMLESINAIGYDPIVMVTGLISNLCIGGTALAVAYSMKSKKQRGLATSVGITALCGITEPAFYGVLIMRPKALIGTAIGALSAGLVAGIWGLQNYIAGFCPGLFTALYFLSPDGSMGNFILYIIVSALSIVVSFLATTYILKRNPEMVAETEMEAEAELVSA